MVSKADTMFFYMGDDERNDNDDFPYSLFLFCFLSDICTLSMFNIIQVIALHGICTSSS
jgi:hypothetical protein